MSCAESNVDRREGSLVFPASEGWNPILLASASKSGFSLLWKEKWARTGASRECILQTASTALPLRKSSGEFKGRLGCSRGRRLGLDESLMDGLRFNEKIPNCP